jgi:Sec-independent protein translocase protein TatA
VSFSVMLFLGLLGLVIFGPRNLVAAGQQAGQMLGRLKKVSSEFQARLATENLLSTNESTDNAGLRRN